MKYLVFLGFLALAYCRPADELKKAPLPADCPPCKNDCPKAVACPYSTVKDRCGCCDVCAAGLDARCDLNGKPHKYGGCGVNLECRLRADPTENLDDETLCFCNKTSPVCGSNNETYDNICRLQQAAASDKDLVPTNLKGACKAAPKIKTAPINTKRPVGSDTFLSCEAKGYPIPTIEWMWKDAEKHVRYLPTDDLHISVNNRGGPERYMVTGWVQIMNIQEEHQGDFTCVAQNVVGMDSKTARVNVDRREGL